MLRFANQTQQDNRLRIETHETRRPIHDGDHETEHLKQPGELSTELRKLDILQDLVESDFKRTLGEGLLGILCQAFQLFKDRVKSQLDSEIAAMCDSLTRKAEEDEEAVRAMTAARAKKI